MMRWDGGDLKTHAAKTARMAKKPTLVSALNGKLGKTVKPVGG